ncbi:hypothetical protein [Vibrio crassostreae]|uniref:hypothetical protein n=1 Tax=Vibrio crassostreae TaxID=246167 RepID=UPI001B31155B|nr:hypothetical protein [Vibrio crassostreae]
MSNFFQLVKKIYLDMGFNPEPKVGFEQFTVEQLFEPDVCLPLLTMAINCRSFADTNETVINEDAAFYRNSFSVFGISASRGAFKPDVKISMDSLKYAVGLIGRLVNDGIDNLTWVALVNNYIDKLNPKGENPAFFAEDFNDNLDKIAKSKYHYSIDIH